MSLLLFYPAFILPLYLFCHVLTLNPLELTAIFLLYAWVLGWLLNDCAIFIKLVGIIKSVDVYAQFATEIISNFRCASESLLVCSPLVEMPAAKLSSTEKQRKSLNLQPLHEVFVVTFCNCSLFKLHFFVSISVPRVREKKVRTGRASYACLRLHTPWCRLVSRRLR